MPRNPAKHPEALVQTPSTPLPSPSLSSAALNFSYAISRGETGVLTFEPYKSLLLPYWAFRTVSIAQSSATTLFSLFEAYVQAGDLVGADMTRKFIQMGMTRARRYANWRGGRKYAKDGEKTLNERWSADGADGADGEEGRKRREKQEASEIFKGYWRRCVEDANYQDLKTNWTREKKEWEKRQRRERKKGECGKDGISEQEVDDDGQSG